jgi:hypothetical protein
MPTCGADFERWVKDGVAGLLQGGALAPEEVAAGAAPPSHVDMELVGQQLMHQHVPGMAALGSDPGACLLPVLHGGALAIPPDLWDHLE